MTLYQQAITLRKEKDIDTTLDIAALLYEHVEIAIIVSKSAFVQCSPLQEVFSAYRNEGTQRLISRCTTKYLSTNSKYK